MFAQPGVTQVYILPPSQTVNAGQTFTVDVSVAPAEAIAGAQFNLSFDQALLTANSVAEGNLLICTIPLTIEPCKAQTIAATQDCTLPLSSP